MRKIALLLALTAFIFTGCSQAAQAPEPFEEAVETPTPTPTPTPSPIPTEAPTPTPAEEPEDEDTGDAFVDFTRKVAGVWGTDDAFFYIFEGDVLKRGWFESDMLPDAHIAKVTELEKNKYEVFVKDQSDENEVYSYEGQDFTVIFDGSRDGFKETFITTSEVGTSLFVRMGDNFEEAKEYEFTGGFGGDLTKLKEEILAPMYLKSGAVGVWYTEDYDEVNNWAGSYKIELTDDGKATCSGWRNRDIGSYKIKDDNHVNISFYYCETDSPDGGWAPVEGFSYTIDMAISGDDAQIKIDAPDVISNLSDGAMHRK